MKKETKSTYLFSDDTEGRQHFIETIVENSSNIFYEHDLDGYFKFISPQIKDILGYSPLEKNIKWQDMLSDNPLNKKGISAAQNAIEKGVKQPPYEVEMLTKDKKKVWFEIRESPNVKNGKTFSIAGVSIDITERMQYEEQLLEREEKYRLLVENQNEIIIKFNLKGQLTYVSPNFCSKFNVKYEEIIGQRYITEVHPDDIEEFNKVLDKSLIPPYDIDHEERMKTSDGWRWFSWANRGIQIENGIVKEIVSVGRDITTRKEAERALKQARLFTDNLIENANVLIIGLDSEAKINVFNPAAEKVTGYSKNELEGKVWFETLVPKETYPHVYNQFNMLLSDNRLPKLIENPILTKRGEERIISWSNSEVRLDGKIAGTISFGIDITERKKAVEELKRSEETSTALLNSFIDSALLLEANGKVLALNERSAKHYNKSKEALIGVNIFDLMEPKVAEQRIQKLTEAKEFKRTIRFEDQRAGMWFDNVVCPIFDEHENIFRYAVYATDITERRKTEEALKLSEEKFSKAFINSPNAITLSSLEDGKILEINEFGARALGYSRDEIIGKTSLELEIITPEDRDKIFEELKDNGSYSELELEVWTHSGEKKIGLFNGQPITIGEDTFLFQTITDITEIRKAEIDLKEQHNLMRTMIDELPLHIFVKNKEHEIVLANKALAKHHNFDSPEELIGKTDFDLFSYKVAERYKYLEQNFMKLNEGFSDKVDQFTDEDGNREWWSNTNIPLRDIEGSCTGIVGIHKNITELIKKEEEINKLALIAKETDNGIIITGVNEKIEWINEGFTKITGYILENVVGKEPSEFLFGAKTNENKLNDLKYAIKKQKKIEVELLITCKDIRLKWVQINVQPVFNEQNEFLRYIGFVLDIDKRKKYEDGLKLSEEKFSKAFLLSPDSVTITSIEDGKIIEVNKGFENIFGYTRDEALGKSTKDLQIWKNPDDRKTVIKLITKNGNVRNFIAEYKEKNNKTGIGEVSMERINIAGDWFLLTIVRDITEKERVERELKESEEKFSATFHSSMDAYAISRLKDGVLIDINEVFCKMFEEIRENIIGKTTLELSIYKNLEDRTKIFELLKKQDYINNLETEFLTKNNRSGWAQFSINKINLPTGVHLFMSIRDITEQKRVQKEIEENHKILKDLTFQLTLAEEKERRRIAVNLHDHLGQSLAMSKIKLSEAKKENNLKKVIEKVDAAKKYLDDSITNSRIITYELSPPVLHELGFSAAIRWLFDQIQEEHGISTEVIDDSLSIVLKEDVRILLFRSAMEIVNNSVKHSSAKKITAEISNDDDYFYVSISDNGVGFDPVNAENEATKKKSFGLFSIRERILFLDGEMQIKAQLGKGTSISLKIPNDFISHKEEK